MLDNFLAKNAAIHKYRPKFLLHTRYFLLHILCWKTHYFRPWPLGIRILWPGSISVVWQIHRQTDRQTDGQTTVYHMYTSHAETTHHQPSHSWAEELWRWHTVKKLAQVSCASFLHQIFVQVHASSADDTSNKNGRSWTKQITFSILSVERSMGTQNFYLNNLNKFKK